MLEAYACVWRERLVDKVLREVLDVRKSLLLRTALALEIGEKRHYQSVLLC